MKKKSPDKKRRVTVRERDWEKHGEASFSHDLVKHRRSLSKVSEQVRDQQPQSVDCEPNALVIAHSKKWGFVSKDGAELLCRIDDNLGGDRATVIAPGDQVYVENEGDIPWIRGVAVRKSKLSRPGAGHATASEQVIAANVDHLIVVAAAADPPFRPGLVDRYLIAAQTGGIEPLLCISKMDLVPGPPEELELYKGLGIRTFCVSCLTGAGLDEMRVALRGTTSVLSGHSGVGKSSLLNKLDPELRLHTQPISGHTGRGQHTTTGGRLYELAGETLIIDTPGIRALGLWEVTPEEVSFYFPDLAEHAASCKFRDCTHTHEPECAVRTAAESGDLNPARVASYLRIRASIESGKTPGRTATSWHANK